MLGTTLNIPTHWLLQEQLFYILLEPPLKREWTRQLSTARNRGQNSNFLSYKCARFIFIYVYIDKSEHWVVKLKAQEFWYAMRIRAVRMSILPKLGRAAAVRGFHKESGKKSVTNFPQVSPTPYPALRKPIRWICNWLTLKEKKKRRKLGR